MNDAESYLNNSKVIDEAGSEKVTRRGGNVLFIAYYLPPMGSSGVQRPLKLIKYLPQFGWNPIVVAPEPGAYHTFDYSLADELSATGAAIHRVAGNTIFHSSGGKARNLSLLPESLKKHFRTISSWFYLPDNKTGWVKPALEKCSQILQDKKNRIDIIFSTAPPYSNHMIAVELGKRHNLPVVLDFRDDWFGSHLLSYPTSWHRNKMRALEQQCLKGASLITAINSAMLDSLKSRDSNSEGKRYLIMPQGFDPADFPSDMQNQANNRSGPFTITYNGIFYGAQRPDVFLQAVKAAIDTGSIAENEIKLQFQGGLEKPVIQLIKKLGLRDITLNMGYLPHKESVKNLMTSDLLWFTVGRQKNEHQVTTGKLYEYVGTGKPILGLVPEGEAAAILDSYPAGYRADPDSVPEVQQTLIEILSKLKSGNIPRPDPAFAGRFDRIKIAGLLADQFEELKSR